MRLRQGTVAIQEISGCRSGSQQSSAVPSQPHVQMCTGGAATGEESQTAELLAVRGQEFLCRVGQSVPVQEPCRLKF